MRIKASVERLLLTVLILSVLLLVLIVGLVDAKTISGGRQSQPCSACMKKLQAKYGKPTVKGEGEKIEEPGTLPVLVPDCWIVK